MGKKSKRNRPNRSPSAQQGSSPGNRAFEDDRRKAPNLRNAAASKNDVESPDNLKFEDPFVEQFAEEDDEEWDDVEEDEEEGNDEGGDGEEVIQSWNPLAAPRMEPGQKLEMDPSAYKLYHALTPEWPSLSFDFVRDQLGESRTRFPHTLIAVVGTQADRPQDNQLTVMKMSDLSRMETETEDDILGEEYDNTKDNGAEDDGDDSDSDEEVDLDPVVEHYSIPHRDGGVNRVRVMPSQSSAERQRIVATWSDAGTVNLFDIRTQLDRFDVSQGKAPPPSSSSKNSNQPFFRYSKHGTEGYAMDWSYVKPGVLATGDCDGKVHVWTPREGGAGYSVVPSYDCRAFRSSSSSSVETNPSIEDLQWSPTEGTVFASGECGGYVRIFDTRAPNRAMLSHKIHSNGADVNVLSWNRLVANLLATGSDDGVLSVWDLRHFSSSSSSSSKNNNSDAAPKPLARFTPHKTPITSVEWHPTDESMLTVTDDDGCYVYDLSVEEDDADAVAASASGDAALASTVPPQLLFVHCGSEQFKEAHWHPQIPSLLMTTALSGYSVLIPSNL